LDSVAQHPHPLRSLLAAANFGVAYICLEKGVTITFKSDTDPEPTTGTLLI
jgi:hypothetical protein